MEQWLEDGNPDNIELLTWAEIHERTRGLLRGTNAQYWRVISTTHASTASSASWRVHAMFLPGALTDLQRGGRKDWRT